MNEKLLEVLIEEYKQLSNYLNNNATAAFRVLSVLITVALAAGLVAPKENVDPILLFILVSGIVFVVFTWMGISQSITNGIGLKLIELEQRINLLVKNGSVNGGHGLSYYSEYIAEGGIKTPGYPYYILWLLIAGILMILYYIPDIYCLNEIVVIAGLSLNFCAFVSIIASEWVTNRKKKGILAKYDCNEVV